MYVKHLHWVNTPQCSAMDNVTWDEILTLTLNKPWFILE